MALGNWGEQLQNAAGAFFGSEYLRDYTHASKTFRTNSYERAPKLKFLFHTYFEINTAAWSGAGQNLGLLVKDIRLPAYSFNTTVLNQYNRKRIVQTKIKYDPIQITFHDDNGNLANKMWYAYYTYYYKDASKINVQNAGKRGSAPPANPVANATKSTMADYNVRNLYEESLQGNDNWGYIGETVSGSNKKEPFFKSVKIYGFNQHNFTQYTLINPIITNFSHDGYNYDEGSGTLKNTMTIDYETVLYSEGAIDGRTPGDIVTGFGDQANYDRTQSPISIPGSNAKILGQNGLVDAVGGFVGALNNNDLLGAAKIAGSTYKTFKNVNLKNTLKAEIQQGLVNSIRNVQLNPTRNTTVATPTNQSSPSGGAGAPTVADPGPATLDANGTAVRTAGVQSGGG
jgi:hypothetical protein